jgi:lipopolysaccharide export system permease protein
MLISLILIPKANFLKEKFLITKKKEASFNIQSSEYGQAFGNWMIYVSKENNEVFKGL